MAKPKVIFKLTKESKPDKRTTSGIATSGKNRNSKTLSERILKGKK